MLCTYVVVTFAVDGAETPSVIDGVLLFIILVISVVRAVAMLPPIVTFVTGSVALPVVYVVVVVLAIPTVVPGTGWLEWFSVALNTTGADVVLDRNVGTLLMLAGVLGVCVCSVVVLLCVCGGPVTAAVDVVGTSLVGVLDSKLLTVTADGVLPISVPTVDVANTA